MAGVPGPGIPIGPDRVVRTLVEGQSVLGVPVAIRLVEHLPLVATRSDPPQWRLISEVAGKVAARVCMPHGPLAELAPAFDAIGTFAISTLNHVAEELAQAAIGNLTKIADGEEPPT